MKPYELTPDERNLLTPEDQQKYDLAIRYCNREDACGPFGGWADGHQMLVDLGWSRDVKTVGHRSYVALVKPEHLNLSKGVAV